jgi:two-component system sensor kinase FixL
MRPANPPPTPAAARRIDRLRETLGPLLVAAETTLLATIFTDGRDADNPIVFANRAFLSLTGFASDAIIGTPLRHFLACVTDTGTISSFQDALEEGRSASCEAQCRRADESEFLAAVFLSPVPGPGGATFHNTLSIVELGGHVERLLDARNEFHAIYEQAPGFIALSAGPEHRFTFANASYRKFVCREQLVGLTVAEALPEIAAQGFVALLDTVYRSGEPYVGRRTPMRIFDPATGDYRVRYCDFVYQAVRDAKNVITGLFCEGYDVSEQHHTAAALADLQSDLIHVSRVNAMGTMATTLAHELNQPLSAIANYTAGARYLIEGGASGDARLIAALQGIEEASQRAADIIRNLRDLTRRREPARAAFDLTVAVSECVRLIRATAPAGIDIIERIPDDAMMAADRVQIQQVLINLLRNACDAVAHRAQQCITIAACHRDDAWVICVGDTGPGVPREAAQSIFSWSGTSKEGGMGLGLAISRTIMEAHRGRIWLENSGSEGAEFCFSVPLDPPELLPETSKI